MKTVTVIFFIFIILAFVASTYMAAHGIMYEFSRKMRDEKLKEIQSMNENELRKYVDENETRFLFTYICTSILFGMGTIEIIKYLLS